MRDDFTRTTIEALADRAGNRCSNPHCRQLTSGPRTDPAKAVNVGVAAHITAASKGGPRYDPALTSEQRRHADNGLWLCQNCAHLVDVDEVRYPADLLRKWKRQAEEAAQREVEGRAPPGDRDADPAQPIHTEGGAYIGGGVQIRGGDFVGRDKIVHGDEVHGDKVEGDKISVSDVSGDNVAIAAGRGAEATATQGLSDPEIAALFKPIYDAIESRSETAPEDRADLKAEVEEIQSEVTKGDEADESFLSRRLRNLKRMAPDILEVVLATMANPAAGLGVVATKVAKRMQAEAS